MLRCPVIALSFLFVLQSLVTTTRAEAVTISVTIESVDTDSRTIAVRHDDRKRTFELSRKTKVLVAGEESEAAALITGDKAKLTYEDTLDVVLEIDAEGLGAGFWQFFDIFKKGATPANAIATTPDGTLVCLRSTPFFCLASPRQYSQLRLMFEFQMPPPTVTSASIYVASRLPRPDQEDWKQQIPLGLEFKLGPGTAREAGDLILPTPDFKVELPLGQLRDGRRVVALRKPVLKPDGWNTLEIIRDEHRNVTIKVNDETINAVAKVENARGYIQIAPKGLELRVRNVVVRTAGKETRLPFETIRPHRSREDRR